MEETMCRVPGTVDEVFIDFKARRAGLMKAFTTDLEEFYRQCDPNPERGNLCLYGFPNGTWKVDLPEEMIPTLLPEPALGINTNRDNIDAYEWLSDVMIHSDAWLISVAFSFGVRLRFSKSERMRLFQMINEQPTMFEAVTTMFEAATRFVKALAQNEGSKNKSSGTMLPQSKDEDKCKGDEEEEEDGDEDESEEDGDEDESEGDEDYDESEGDEDDYESEGDEDDDESEGYEEEEEDVHVELVRAIMSTMNLNML